MNQERTDRESHEAFVDKITNAIRREAEGRSDDYVYRNYENAAHLFKSATERVDELTSVPARSVTHYGEINQAETALWQRQAESKAWSELAEDRRLEALKRDGNMREAPRPSQYRQLAEGSVADMAVAEQRGRFWNRLVDRLRGNREHSAAPPQPPSAPLPARASVDMAENPKPPPLVVDTGRASGDAPTGAERLNPDREAAQSFRQLSQAERLREDGMKAGAKMVAAIDAAIDRKYGTATPAADNMKRAARESVAQTLEQGGHIAIPRVRGDEQQRESGVEQVRDADRQARERDR